MAQKTHKLGDLQLAIMQVLWKRGEVSVTEVHQALLEERGLASTTIATMLVKMEAKGVVTHRTEGRRYIYRPTATEAEVRHTMVGEITERLFEGSPAALVSYLLEAHDVDAQDLEELEALLADRNRQEKKS